MNNKEFFCVHLNLKYSTFILMPTLLVVSNH